MSFQLPSLFRNLAFLANILCDKNTPVDHTDKLGDCVLRYEYQPFEDERRQIEQN